ncbi:hypothetical protein M153_5730003976 [Pseudoloma neurophilia]|uniref:Uncharacterized protein n=1 Tax=Pseudoloma neurophilia TaxID=146866 RepID=A0A0R0LWR5_9MICR|nr:hypothetical protein M153_5730003976 [Pseudoloma neurophilia]
MFTFIIKRNKNISRPFSKKKAALKEEQITFFLYLYLHQNL